MSVTRPDRLGEIDEAAAQARADQATANPAAVNEVEGDIREFVRRDISIFRRTRSQQPDAGEIAADNIGSLIQRVSGQSVEEIERVIGELTQVRDMLRSEGDRVQREIAGYAALSQAAMTSMKIIADSLAQWRPNEPEARRG